jgi:hypothetical protein
LVERTLELYFFDQRQGLAIGFARLFFRSLAGFPEVEEDDEIFDGGVYGFVELDPVFIQLDVLEDLRSPLVIVPEARA